MPVKAERGRGFLRKLDRWIGVPALLGLSLFRKKRPKPAQFNSIGICVFAAIGDANSTYYTIVAQTGTEWEVGIGTYTSSGTTLARTTVLANSAGTQPTALSFSAGPKDVFVTYPS